MKAYYTIDTATAVQAAENLWGADLRLEKALNENAKTEAKKYHAAAAFYDNAPFLARLFMKRPKKDFTYFDLYSAFRRDDYILTNSLKAALPLIETVSLDITNGLERQVAEECKRIVEKEAQ